MLSVISNFREASVHFLICSASPHDVVLNASGPSVHFPGAFAKFQDNVRGAEAFGTTRGRCRRCGCRDDLRTTTRTRCRRCAEVHFRIQILLSTKILRRKLFDVRNVRKYPEWFRNDKNSVQIKTWLGICGQVADFQFLLSTCCPRSSGRTVSMDLLLASYSPLLNVFWKQREMTATWFMSTL